MLSPEPIDIADIIEKRRQSAQQTLREATDAELHALINELFPDVTHAWYESSLQFLKDHSGEQAYRGETEDGYGFVFFPKAHRGLWYMTGPVRAVGILKERALAALDAILVGQKKG